MSALIHSNSNGAVTSLDLSPPSLVYPTPVFSRSHIAPLPKKKSSLSRAVYPLTVEAETDMMQPQSGLSNLSLALLDSRLRSSQSPSPPIVGSPRLKFRASPSSSPSPSPSPPTSGSPQELNSFISKPAQSQVRNYNRLPTHPGLSHARTCQSLPVSAQNSPVTSPSSSPPPDEFIADNLNEGAVWYSNSYKSSTPAFPIKSIKTSKNVRESSRFASVDDCELIGKAGDSGTNSAYLVRVKGRLSIFKPVNGEAYEEQRSVSQPISNRTRVKIYESSPYDSPGQSPFPSEPESPITAIEMQKPSDMPKTPMRKGIHYGDCVLKEKASFVLDSPDHFSGVPHTDAVRMWLPRDTEDLPVVDPATVVAVQIENSTSALSLLDSSKSMVIPASKPIAIPSPIRNSHSLNSLASFTNPATDSRLLTSLQAMNRFVEPKVPFKDNSMVEIYGSLQDFVPHIGSADDVGSSLFPADEVHRIGILDIRLLNLDRHHGNMLVRRDENGFYHLTPIDHGYILPSYNELSDVHLEWTYWKQAGIPFSQVSLDYIASLNPIVDIQKLKEVGIRGESILSMVFSTLLLQRSASMGFTLQQIARLVQREMNSSNDDYERVSDSKQQSFLEHIVGLFFNPKAPTNVDIEGSDTGFSPLPSPVSSAVIKEPHMPIHSFSQALTCASLDTIVQIFDSQDRTNLMLQGIVRIIDQELSKILVGPLAITPL